MSGITIPYRAPSRLINNHTASKMFACQNPACRNRIFLDYTPYAVAADFGWTAQWQGTCPNCRTFNARVPTGDEIPNEL